MQEKTAPLPIPAPPPLVHNERVKLTAAAIDRLSTALMVVGVLGQALSLTPATASVSQGLNVLSWFSGALVLHLIARRVLGRLKS